MDKNVESGAVVVVDAKSGEVLGWLTDPITNSFN